MAVGSPIKRFLVSPRRAGASFLLLLALVSLLVLPTPGWALGESAADAADDAFAADGQSGAEDPAQHSGSQHDTAAGAPARRYGPPGATPGVPSPAELESAGAVIGRVLVDNQNIFDLEDPKDNNWLFRLGNDLHPKTRAEVIRHQLLFKPGDRYSRHMVDESERILRADGYFYDAWIRE
ncbi:MAG TPA: POTRA domain-containing protein, partial [Steroidobacteraceae bacterium]